MKIIKFEAVHAERFFADLFADARAAKKALDEFCLEPIFSSKSALKGFIQHISQDPYELVLFSDIQVKLDKKEMF